jgi:hypothetical protein
MSKHIVYRLASGPQEYTDTAEAFERMVQKHPGSFIKIREENAKEVRTPTSGEAPVVKIVPPAPRAARVKADPKPRGAGKAQPAVPKEVKKGPGADRVKPPASQLKEESNAPGSSGGDNA